MNKAKKKGSFLEKKCVKRYWEKVSTPGKNFYHIEEYRNFPKVLKGGKMSVNMPDVRTTC